MNQTVIVTGASSGIGVAIAKAFGDAGYAVVLTGRDRGRCESVAATIKTAAVWNGDLQLAENCAALTAFALEQFGRLDVLVNNAGVIHRADALGTSDSMWRHTMAVNLDAPFFLSRAALPHLIASRGVIVNVASDWGLRGGKLAAAYCASKGALVLLSKAMALDHAADGVRVNAICPGDVDTPMLEIEAQQRGVDYAQAMRDNNAAVPTGRITTPEEVAALALFLASPAAAQITGAAIPIDGGANA